LRFGAKHLAFLVGGGGGAIVVVGGFFARVLCRHCLPLVITCRFFLCLLVFR